MKRVRGAEKLLIVSLIFLTIIVCLGGVSAVPRITVASVTPNITNANPLLTATAIDSNSSYAIVMVEYFVGAAGADGTGTNMTANDGNYDSRTENVNSTINIGNLSQGNHVVFIHGLNNNSEWDSLVNISFIKDTVVPYLNSSQINGGDGSTNKISPKDVDGLYDSVTIIMNASESVDWRTLYIKDYLGNNVKWYFCTNWTLSCIRPWDGKDSSGNYVPDGNYTIVLPILSDTARNVNSSITIGTVEVDNTKPIAAVSVSPPTTVWGGSLFRLITLIYDEMMNTTIKPIITFIGFNPTSDMGNWTSNTTYQQTFNFTGIQQDRTTVTMQINNSANDIVGNNESYVSGTFILDTQAPNITAFQNYTTYTNGTIKYIINNDNDVTINATITDGSGVSMVILEENSTGNPANHTLSAFGNFYNYTILKTNLSNQERVFWKYYANDTLGNTINSSTYSFKVENRAPIFNTTAGNIQNLSWVEDSGSETVHLRPYFYDLDGDEINFTSSIILFPGPTSNPLGGNVTRTINNTNKNATLSSTEDWNGNATVVFYGVDFVGESTPSNNVYVVVIPDENEMPTLTTSISPINFSEDNALSMNLVCNPEDIGQICLNYRYDANYSNYSSGLIVNVNNITGAITLSTKQDWNGITYVRFLADDNGFPVRTGDLVAKVNVTPVNDNPLLNIPDQNVNEDSSSFALNLTTYTTDVDNSVPGEMTWKLISQSDVNLINCSITGSNLNCLAPSLNQVGYNNLIIEVNDSAGGVGNKIVRINVNNVNDAPVINSSLLLPLTYTTQEDTPLALYLKPYESDVDSYDVDSNLTWSVSGVDTNLFTTSINNATDTLIVSPLPNKFGTDIFTLTLTDSMGATDSKTLTLNVTSVNDLPVLNTIPALTTTIGKLFTYQVNASDIDGNTLTFSDDSALFNIQTAGNSGIISFTPILTSYGNYLVNISVGDGQGGMDFQIVNLFIDFDKAPIITSYSPAGNLLIKTGNSQNFSVVAQDDGPILNYQWTVNNGTPLGTNPAFSYNFSTAGFYELKVAVSDGINTVNKSWLVTATDYPIASEFNGAGTTNLSSMTDFGSVNNLILENQYGKIEFLSPVNLNNAWDLNSNVEIANGIVAINTQNYPALNKPAKITLYNLVYSSIPKIYYTNSFTTTSSAITQECPSSQCEMINYTDFSTTNRQATFNVSGFSSFLVKGSGAIYDLNKLDISRCKSGVQGNLTLDISNPDGEESYGPGEEIKIKIDVSNDGDTDKRVLVKGILYNIDREDEEEKEESDSQKIEAGDSGTYEFSITVPDDFREDDSYFLFLKAYQKGSEESQCNYEIVDLSLEREEHKIIIDNIITSPLIAYPGQSINMEIRVKNVGSSDEEQAYVKVTNSQLKISEKSESFDLEEYGGDDETTISQDVLIPYGTPEGEYPFKVEVFFDGESNYTTETISVVNSSLVPLVPENIIHLSSATPIVAQKAPSTGNIVYTKPSEIKTPDSILAISLASGEKQDFAGGAKSLVSANNNSQYILIGLIAGIIIVMLLIIVVVKKKR